MNELQQQLDLLRTAIDGATLSVEGVAALRQFDQLRKETATTDGTPHGYIALADVQYVLRAADMLSSAVLNNAGTKRTQELNAAYITARNHPRIPRR